MNAEYESLRESLLADIEVLQRHIRESELPIQVMRHLSLGRPRRYSDAAIHEHLWRIEHQIELLKSHGGKVCALAETQGGDRLARFLSGVSDAKQDRKVLRNWLTGCRDLIITDPYLLSSGPTFGSEHEYVEALVRLLPQSLDRLDVFHLPSPSKKIRRAFRDAMAEKKIHCRYFPTTRIHDRVWIKDGREAVSVGTSFGGYGNKLAFILDIPEADLVEFQQELETIKRAVRNGEPLYETTAAPSVNDGSTSPNA